MDALPQPIQIAWQADYLTTLQPAHIGVRPKGGLPAEIHEEDSMNDIRFRLRVCCAALVCTALLVIHPSATNAQALVIEGGTLIDGNGGPPVAMTVSAASNVARSLLATS